MPEVRSGNDAHLSEVKGKRRWLVLLTEHVFPVHGAVHGAKTKMQSRTTMPARDN